MSGIVHLDHTADIGVELEAASLEELYEEAALALTDALTDVATVRPVETRRLRVTASDPELLLVEWLEELVYLFDVEAFVAGSAKVEVRKLEGVLELLAEARGERFDPDRHPTKVAIKGVTYHGLEVSRRGERFFGRVIFDI